MWRHLRRLAATPVRLRSRRQADHFVSLLQDCRGTQQKILGEILRLNADSAFSRDHGLDRVRSIADFQRALPVAGYERALPYVERTMQGERTALLGERNPPVMFALSSGTTAATKYVPITRRFVDDYRRGWQIWGIRSFDAHPQMHLLNIFQAASDYDKFRTPGGIPCGNISGLVQQLQSPAVKLMYTIPDAVTKIGDPDAKYYAALRAGVADPHVGIMMTANPSTLLQIARLADRHAQHLIRDLHDGTLSSEFEISPAIRKSLGRVSRRRDVGRARELERILSREGRLRPADLWRDLQILAVWTAGSVGAYLPQLREWYGPVAIRDHGLSASEGRMTIPLRGDTSAGPLDIQTHFFEFVPVDEIDSADPTVLLGDELEVGQDYFILLTTVSGLYRYDIRDVVRCTGFHGTTPELEFRHKGAHISSITGEKLTESQVAEALRDASREADMPLPPVTLCPEWGDPPRYQLLIEAGAIHCERRVRQFAESIDARLRATNVEYEEKRATRRLDTIAVRPLANGTWARYMRSRQSAPGGSLEQYKHAILKPDLDFAEKLRARFEEGTGDQSAARAA